MNDYLEIFEKFKDVKDIIDIYNEVLLLRAYYRAGQYEDMQKHIIHLMNKYDLETRVWNSANTVPPQSYYQSFINAENFLCAKGVKIIVEKAMGYKNRLTPDEISFIESVEFRM